jgi:hypothetical protein
MSADAMTTGAGQTYATATCDPMGDDLGIIEYGQSTASDREDIVSARWVASRLRSAGNSTYAFDPDEIEHLGGIGDALSYVADQMRWGAALHSAWAIASRESGRAKSGDLYDCADLFVSGRGAIEELVTNVLRGDYRDAPRGDDGELLLTEADRVDDHYVPGIATATESMEKFAEWRRRTLQCWTSRRMIKSVGDASDGVEIRKITGKHPHLFDVLNESWVKGRISAAVVVGLDLIRDQPDDAVDLDYLGSVFLWAGALAKAWAALARARNGRVLAGDAIDAADLVLTGRGTVMEVFARRFRGAPRNADGDLIIPVAGPAS